MIKKQLKSKVNNNDIIKDGYFMGLFNKKIKVWTDKYDHSMYIKISLGDDEISKMSCILQGDGVLLLADIIPFSKEKYYSKGYGTMMMNELFDYAKNNQINSIVGNLSIVDEDHKDRLHAFYRKNGFDIIEYSENKNCYYGKVVKLL